MLRKLSPKFSDMQRMVLFSGMCLMSLLGMSQPIDVVHYVYTLTVHDTSDTLAGIAEITFRPTGEMNQVSFDLQCVDPSSGKGMTVQRVQWADADITFQHHGNKIFLTSNKSFAPRKNTKVTIWYTGIPEDGLIIGNNKHGDRTFFGDNWPDRAHHWLPCKDHPSDKATVEFKVNAPEHYQVIANGWQVEETNQPQGYKYTHWKENVPLPTKVMVIGVARFAVKQEDAVEGIPLSSWVYPQDREAGYSDYALAQYPLRYFMEMIGPYPFEKLANVQSKTRYGGMENAGNIFYFEGSVTGLGDHEELIAHEVAHQWFGNSASESDWPHIWLSEGFATYLTNMYMEHSQGPEKMLDLLQKQREAVFAFAKKQWTPIVDTAIKPIIKLLNTNSYQKAGWVLHMLRQEVGDVNFKAGLKKYYQQYAVGNAITGQFKQVMEDVSGFELDDFFKQWLYQAGHPQLKISWRQDNEYLLLDITQLQEENFSFPLDIKIKLSTGAMDFPGLTMTNKQHSWSFKVKGTVQGLVVDPETKMLVEVVN